jgi:hypothetical protein
MLELLLLHKQDQVEAACQAASQRTGLRGYTSVSTGGEGEESRLTHFAADLFGEPFADDAVIGEQYAPLS